MKICLGGFHCSVSKLGLGEMNNAIAYSGSLLISARFIETTNFVLMSFPEETSLQKFHFDDFTENISLSLCRLKNAIKKNTRTEICNMFILENNKMNHFFPNNFCCCYIITCTDFVSGANREKGFSTMREGPLFVF